MVPNGSREHIGLSVFPITGMEENDKYLMFPDLLWFFISLFERKMDFGKLWKLGNTNVWIYKRENYKVWKYCYKRDDVIFNLTITKCKLDKKNNQLYNILSYKKLIL